MTAQAVAPSAAWKRKFALALLTWFRAHARDLPWRQTRDLYRIWVSEIMLQQTQVATVRDYYQRFLEEFPDVQTLAAADEARVLRLWEGLGYYRRARQLHAAAQQIVAEHQGRFPQAATDVLALPGIGKYTAHAILSLGQDQRLPILEANTIRLFSRLAAFRGDATTAAGQQFLWQFAEAILPREQTGAFNQALMELGSLLCTPRQPRCEECPVAQLCPTFQHGWQEQIPSPKKKVQFEEVTEAAILIRKGRRVLLRRCLPGERWAGLWDFVRFAVPDQQATSTDRELISQTQLRTGLTINSPAHLGTLRHGVTRYRITLHAYTANGVRGRLRRDQEFAWVEADELAEYPLSTTGRKLTKWID
jgi:A/G-specific adenine glycosylase